MATTTNIDELLEWFEDPSNRSYFNSDLLTVKKSPISTGLGVFAKKSQIPIPSEQDDEENNLLLRVHKSMVLSAQTCTISNLLYGYDNLSGMYGLVLAFIYEKRLGDKSPWFKYLNSINYRNDKGEFILPLCLNNEKDLKILKNSEIDFMGGLDSEDLKNHFEVSLQFAEFLKNEFNWEIPSELKNFDEFAAITMAIASRAFEIDNYIELALVPGADLFNHNAYGEENVHFVTLGDVCPFCGKDEESGCRHCDYGPPDSEEEDEGDDEDGNSEDKDKDDGEDDSEDEEEEEEDIKEITMDFINKIEKELEEEKNAESSEEEDDSEEEFDMREFYLNPDECCDIVIENKITKNKEIFNTYGELPNSILLVKYGFAVEKNPYDSICLGNEIIEYRNQHPELEERIDWWSCMGWILLREQDKADDNESDEELDDDDDDDDDDEDDDDEDQEKSWLLQCRVEYPGKVNNQLLAVSKLFALTEEEFESLIGDEDCDGETIKKTLCKREKQSKKKSKLKNSNPILQEWVESKLGKYSVKTSREANLNIKNNSSNHIRSNMYQCIAGEMALLESL